MTAVRPATTLTLGLLLAAILIVVLSVLPAGFEWLKARREHAAGEAAADEA